LKKHDSKQKEKYFMTREISFSKLSGAGNDFVIIDNRDRSLFLDQSEIAALCRRRTGIGADGLILIEPSLSADFLMKYHNADGLEGSMCGNGGRAAVWFAHAVGVPFEQDGGCRFEAGGNPYRAWITAPETVRLQMLEPRGFRNNIETEEGICHFVDTGSPHAIFYSAGLEGVDVVGRGRKVRHMTDLFQGGTNVNFIEITSPDSLSLRTFERGVEDETLACGTGAVAAALMSHRLGMIPATTIRVRVRSGNTLEVRFSENMKEVFLTGPAHVIYQGTVRVG
jgi:diaminopimelate epimerase